MFIYLYYKQFVNYSKLKYSAVVAFHITLITNYDEN